MSDEDWVKAAMTDDSVVVELLVRLHQAPPPPPPTKSNLSHPALPLEWTVRQRRSKPILLGNKNTTAPRASPATPLSWSGGTSVSGGGGADGSEESSRPPSKRPDTARSKATATSETTTNKRTRKKKTLAELKEEETLLLKERRHLKKELANLRVTFEKQRATNESLKRLKLDLESQLVVETVTAVASVKASPHQTRQKIASCDPFSPISPPEIGTDDYNTKQQPSTPKSSSQLQQIKNPENKFVLPDLNLPLDEGSNS